MRPLNSVTPFATNELKTLILNLGTMPEILYSHQGYSNKAAVLPKALESGLLLPVWLCSN